MLEENLDKLREKYERDPDSLIFAQYGDTLRKAKRIDEAITILEDGLRKHPNYATGYMILGRCYRDKDAIEAAIKEFEKAVELDKQSILAHKELGDLYIQEGQINRAIDILQKLLNLDPLDDAARDKLRGLRERVLEEEKNVPSSVGKDDFFSFFEEEKTKESMEVPTEIEPLEEEIHKKNIPEEEIESFLEPKEVPEQPSEAETTGEETPPVEETREKVEPVSAQPVEEEIEETPIESVEEGMGELPEKKNEKETTAAIQGTKDLNPKFTLELARLYKKYNFNDKALAVLENILEKEPDNTDASLMLNEIKGLSPLEEIKKPSPPMEQEKPEDTSILKEIGRAETPIEMEPLGPQEKEEGKTKKEEGKKGIEKGTENVEPKSLSDLFGEDENE